MAYHITTDAKEYSTDNAKEAASVACDWQARGMEPHATVITDVGNAPLRIDRVEITTVTATAKALTAMRAAHRVGAAA